MEGIRHKTHKLSISDRSPKNVWVKSYCHPTIWDWYMGICCCLQIARSLVYNSPKEFCKCVRSCLLFTLDFVIKYSNLDELRFGWMTSKSKRTTGRGMWMELNCKRSQFCYLLGYIQTTKKFRYILIAALPWKASSSYYALSINFIVDWAMIVVFCWKKIMEIWRN